MEPGGDVAADGGFAGADLAGHEPDAAQLDEVFEPGFGFAAGGGGIEFIGLEGVLERESGEREVAQVHYSSSSLWWLAKAPRVRREGGGSGAGVSVSRRQEGRSRRTVVLA